MAPGAPVVAVLGPTNTGKTHRAVERMLEHGSGLMGFPLRLLAREVYDRVTARVGEARVALVTGEEKRVPRRPDYWICTVEAMPLDREVDFLAVDEVQLAAHDQRGHVFTDRLLHARGRVETWFLGSDIIRPLLAELVPAARVAEHSRLSRLTYAGPSRLSRVPARSAIVAFSMTQVYELAERLRALRGGTAVVLGALSPRARNAQVAMFQAGEVDYLVATDAIGMGLNLDVQHVAFAALRKFDGREARELDAAELAQIAGRAGRWIHDGTFGTLEPLALGAPVARAIESHSFSPLRRVRWRRHELDFASPAALLASLRERSPRSYLALAHDAEDTLALERLAADPDIAARAKGRTAVELLWEVCGVPDFRKLLFESHVEFLRELYLELSRPQGRLDPVWLATRIAELDDDQGDADTLMARMASIRTFTYVSGKAAWVDDAEHWQEKTRAIEDRLSDALHAKLVQRFVTERRKSTPRARPRGRAVPTAAHEGEEKRSTFHDKLRALRDAMPGAPAGGADASPTSWVEDLVAAPHAALRHDPEGIVYFEDRAVARLVPGPSLTMPEARLLDLQLGAGAQSRAQRRVVAYARDVVATLLEPLRELEEGASPPVRGILYAIRQGLGTARVADVAPALSMLTENDARKLDAGGVVLGRSVVLARELHRPAALAERAFLVRLALPRVVLPAPAPGVVSFRAPRTLGAPVLLALGFVPAGPRAVRADVVERVLAALREEDVPALKLASWLGCSTRQVDEILASLTEAPAAEPERPPTV